MSKKPQHTRKAKRTQRQPRPIPTERGIFLRLSDTQIAQIIQEAGDGGLKTFLSARLEEERIRQSLSELLDDPVMNSPGISRSVVMGWVVFAAFTPPGTHRGVIEIARELEMSPSTTHRYITTLKELGLVEKTVRGRYKIAVADVRD